MLAGLRVLAEQEQIYQGRFEELRREVLLGALEAELPTDGIPITSWNDRDEAFLNVVEGIRGAVESLTR